MTLQSLAGNVNSKGSPDGGAIIKDLFQYIIIIQEMTAYCQNHIIHLES